LPAPHELIEMRNTTNAIATNAFFMILNYSLLGIKALKIGIIIFPAIRYPLFFTISVFELS
jgi:hypothetical protein